MTCHAFTKSAYICASTCNRSHQLDGLDLLPIIDLRGHWTFSDKWSATALSDLGSSFGDSSDTWQILGTMNYSFNEYWHARFGYRHMDVSKETDGRDVDIGLSGPVVGVTYQF